jgi:hypothetical protein
MRKKRRESGAAEGRHIRIPYRILNTEQWASLSPHAVKLLTDLLWQYYGNNNGALAPCWTLMRPRGWRSSSTLHNAKNELLDKGFIVVTRQGSKRRGNPTLVAITWNGIDEVRKLDYDESIKCEHSPLSYWCKSPVAWHPDHRRRILGE